MQGRSLLSMRALSRMLVVGNGIQVVGSRAVKIFNLEMPCKYRYGTDERCGRRRRALVVYGVQNATTDMKQFLGK
jgi:hypothetical protein